MPSRIVLTTAAAVLLLVAAGAIQLADPQFGDRRPPSVDFSEPPAQVAADAATQFEYVDYAYRIDFRQNRSGEWRQVRTMRVDNTDHEFYKTGPIGEKGVVLYGTDAVTFVRPSEGARWRVTFLREVLYNPHLIAQPFLVNRLSGSNASIISTNRSQYVVRINLHLLKVARELPGNTTLYINKTSGRIDYAEVVYHPKPSQTLYLRFQLTGTRIDVKRPPRIPFSFREVFWDLMRGPLVNLSLSSPG